MSRPQPPWDQDPYGQQPPPRQRPQVRTQPSRPDGWGQDPYGQQYSQPQQGYPPQGSQQQARQPARSAPRPRKQREVRKGPLIFLLICLAAVVGVVVIVVSNSGAQQPPKAAPLPAHQREVDALAAWERGDGGQMYGQTVSDLKAFDASPTQANAQTLWEDTGITLRNPPPYPGRAQWIAALRDWQEIAQLAGGDPGAPTGSPAEIIRYSRAATRHIDAADAELPRS